MLEDEDKTINLFLLADLHVGSHHDTVATFKQGLANMQKKDPNATYIINGDITTAGKSCQYDDVWRIMNSTLPANADTIISLGNHDVRGPFSHDWNNYQESDPAYFRDVVVPDYQQHYLAPKLGSNQLYFAVVRGTYQFIVLNTEKGLKDSAYLSKAQLLWLDQQLTHGTQSGLTNMVVVHQALRDTHWRSNFGGGFGIQDAAVKTVLKRHPNTFVLSGHIHNGLGVCEVIPREYGTCIDQPAYTVSENGYVGKGLGYYCHFSRSEMVFEAWDFVTMQHLNQFDFTLPTITLASVVDSDDVRMTALMHQTYDQRLFNDPETDDATDAPKTALFPAATREQVNAFIASSSVHVKVVTDDLDLVGDTQYFTKRDEVLSSLSQSKVKLQQSLMSDLALETRLSQQAVLARLDMVLANSCEFSDAQLNDEYRLSSMVM